MSTETATEGPARRGRGEMFGPYRLEETIGRGGMGEVFRAHDTGRDRTVALKRLRPGLAQDDEYQERFRRESRVAARLSSPHVVPIHDFGEIDGSLFIDMRLVSGVDLGVEIERRGRLEPGRAADIVRQIADALDAAHDDGLVHRDVKPSNVLLVAHRGRDFVYLVDFGIVRSVAGGEHSRGLTSAGLAIGTVSYMAPEMFLGDTVDRRADVYALACVLFETLAGRPPFVGEGPALMYEHLHATPPRLSALLPDVPAAIEGVLERGMAKDPRQRYAGAGDLADAAYEALTGMRTPVATGPEDAPGRLVPVPRTPSEPTATPGGPGGPGAVSLRKGAVAPTPGPHGAPASSGPVLPPGHPSGPQSATPTVLGPGAPPGPAPAHGVPSGPGPLPMPGQGPPPPYGYGYGPGMPPAAPFAGAGPDSRRQGRSAMIAWIAFAVVGAILLVLCGLLVIGMLVGDDRPAGPAPAAGPVPAAAPDPADTSGATLRSAFPDIAARNCVAYTPQDGEYVTSSGVRPVALYRCAYEDAAPNGYVYYAQWPDQASADRYQADQRASGASTDGTVTWGPGQDVWGPMHTRQAQGYLYSTGTYDTRPFSFDIAVTNLAERDAVLRTMRLLPANQLPTG